MSAINFEKKLEKYKKRRSNQTQKELRTIKFISVCVNTIIKNNSKILTNKDIKDICLKVYNKYDKISHVRVRNMMNKPAIKEKIDNELLRVFTERGLDPLSKTADLVEKAENVAEKTGDYMQVARFYKELSEIKPKHKIREERTYNNYSDLKEDKPSKVKRTVENKSD